jgi:hypothetical protein
VLRRLCAELVDRAGYRLTLARLTVLDWLAAPPETRLIALSGTEGERLRKAFPQSLKVAAVEHQVGAFGRLKFGFGPVVAEIGGAPDIKVGDHRGFGWSKSDGEGRIVWARIRRAIEALLAAPSDRSY